MAVSYKIYSYDNVWGSSITHISIAVTIGSLKVGGAEYDVKNRRVKKCSMHGGIAARRLMKKTLKEILKEEGLK